MLRPLAVVVILLTGVTPVMASDRDASDNSSPRTIEVKTSAMTGALSPKRPAMLPALYGGFVALQVLDAYTTAGAVDRGAREVNPLLGRGNQATLWTVKAVTTASTVYFVERLWKKENRLAAVLVMAGINGGYVAIAAHNARQTR